MSRRMSLRSTPLLMTKSAIFPRRLMTRIKVNMERAQEEEKEKLLEQVDMELLVEPAAFHPLIYHPGLSVSQFHEKW